MLKLTHVKLAVVGALLSALLIAAPASAAEKAKVTVRAVTWQGKVLAEKTVRTGTTTVRTSPKAKCFGPDATGAGYELEGPTALGALWQASTTTPSLKPLLLTNAADFALGVCGIGGQVAKGEEWWYLKVNHKGATTGGDLTKVKNGDVILWYLSESYNINPGPDELYLQAPKKAARNRSFKVKVFAYSDLGKRKPAAGVKVTGAAAPTNAAGVARVTLKKTTRLIARSGKLIPSNRATVCVGAKCK